VAGATSSDTTEHRPGPVKHVADTPRAAEPRPAKTAAGGRGSDAGSRAGDRRPGRGPQNAGPVGPSAAGTEADTPPATGTFGSSGTPADPTGTDPVRGAPGARGAGKLAVNRLATDGAVPRVSALPRLSGAKGAPGRRTAETPTPTGQDMRPGDQQPAEERGTVATEAVGTEAVNTGAVGTGTVGTGPVGTGAVGTGTVNTGAVGTILAGSIFHTASPARLPAASPAPERRLVLVSSATSAAVSDAATTPASPSVVGLLTSVVFSLFSGLERLVNGPPKVPPNSTVTVRSSTLQITDGLSVPADWYYPAGDDPPTRMILLQHGFAAIGPMYSYTAATLAEETHSIVVAPTLTSNPFADGGLWLWGDGMSRSVADLFTGDRTALTQSALAAGYAEQYDLNPATAALPRQFALVGHSAGGAAVSGTAGYLAENGAAADLVGVILLDGVPFGDTLPDALTRLDAYEQATGRYIPVRNIGAPLSIWNFPSNANLSLSQARPDRFNGVVLAGGVHTDSMQGASPLIEFVLSLLAGSPQPQNQLAVQELSVAWLNDWFGGRTSVGDDLVPGSTIAIATPEGTATATVIGPSPDVATGRSAALPLSA
jgi:hypothetical protein